MYGHIWLAVVLYCDFRLIENLKVCRAGYAHRMPFERFLVRYKMLSKATWPIWKKTPKQGCKEILKV